MSDYSNTFGGAAKDAANSTILGADHDTEYDAIAAASATKANKTGAPATTNNLAMLTATGDLADSLVESDGSGNITANVTGNLTGNVTGNVTGASTVDVDTITADTTNGDLNLARNGTGDITVDSVPIYGLVILDTPVLLASSLTQGSWTTIDMSVAYAAAATAGAKKAIIRMILEDSKLGTSTTMNGYIRKTGSGLTNNYLTRIIYATEFSDSGTSTTGAAAVSEATVNLDSNSDFDYYVDGVVAFDESEVVLVGYYV